MQKVWLGWLVDKFVTEETMIRCCGSCHGGCTNPAICLMCCGYTAEDISKYVDSKGKDNLWKEFTESELYQQIIGGI